MDDSVEGIDLLSGVATSRDSVGYTMQLPHVFLFFCFFFNSPGGWVKVKLKLPHFHVSYACRVSI